MCLYPKLIKNRKYQPNKKNKGIIPHMKDPRLNYVPVACGRCMECAKATARTWQTRLSEEIKKPIKAIFVTLTFSDYENSKLYNEIKDVSYYDIDNRIATKAVRRFTELYRKYTKKTLRHWLIIELVS